jgi:hypothetical protein
MPVREADVQVPVREVGEVLGPAPPSRDGRTVPGDRAGVRDEVAERGVQRLGAPVVAERQQEPALAREPGHHVVVGAREAGASGCGPPDLRLDLLRAGHRHRVGERAQELRVTAVDASVQHGRGHEVRSRPARCRQVGVRGRRPRRVGDRHRRVQERDAGVAEQQRGRVPRRVARRAPGAAGPGDDRLWGAEPVGHLDGDGDRAPAQVRRHGERERGHRPCLAAPDGPTAALAQTESWVMPVPRRIGPAGRT